MSIQLARRLIQVDEYYRMAEVGILTENDRVELIYGEIIEMSPIGNKHASVVDRLNKTLNNTIGDTGIIRVQGPVRINDLNEPEPDLTLLKLKEDYYADAHPTANDVLVIIEVSDTTYQYDREIKSPLYASAEIPEFWLVNVEKKEVEVYTSPAKGAYKKMEIFYPEDTLSLRFCNRSVAVKEILG
ncbi:MAG: Uma2 family endonuclease [Cytophagales bacterium]|nr:Uma2 family endonuclease [Cytophagales bacterium]